MKKIFLIIFCLFMFSSVAHASSVLDDQLGQLNFDEVQKEIHNISEKDSGDMLKNFNFFDEVKKIISGETNLSIDNLIKLVGTTLVKEVKANFIFIIQILLLVILSAVIKSLTDSFQNKEAGEIAFYVCYLLILIAIIKSFQIAIGIASDTINNILSLMKIVIPIFISTVVTTGNITTATTANAFVFASISYVALIIKSIFLPIVTYLGLVQLINFLSEKEMLNELTDLGRKSVVWGLKSMVAIFLGLSTIQRFTAPVLDGITKKGVALTTKTFVPVLGDVMNSAVDTFLNCTILIKNSVGIVAVVAIVVVCFIPLIKILTFIITYKLAAAIMQPIAEKRVVKCLSEFANNCTIIFGCVVTVVLSFVVSIAMLITVGS